MGVVLCSEEDCHESRRYSPRSLHSADRPKDRSGGVERGRGLDGEGARTDAASSDSPSARLSPAILPCRSWCPNSWGPQCGAEMLIVGGRTLKSALEDKVRRLGDAPFIRFEDAEGHDGGSWTWREFDQQVNRAANLLQARGLRHGDKFNLHLGNCPEFLTFWLAAAKSGTVMVPTNPVSTADEMAYILAHSETRLVITEPRYAAAIAAARGRLTGPLEVLECRPLAPLLAGMKDTAPDVRVIPENEISMQYTSGTTSKPKGVLLTHANYVYGGEVMAKAMRVLPRDRHLIVLPLFHAGAQLHAFLPMLLVGGSVALVERFSATRFVDQAIRHEATLAALFAAPIRILLSQPRTPREGQTRLRAVSYAQNIT